MMSFPCFPGISHVFASVVAKIKTAISIAVCYFDSIIKKYILYIHIVKEKDSILPLCQCFSLSLCKCGKQAKTPWQTTTTLPNLESERFKPFSIVAKSRSLLWQMCKELKGVLKMSLIQNLNPYCTLNSAQLTMLTRSGGEWHGG